MPPAAIPMVNPLFHITSPLFHPSIDPAAHHELLPGEDSESSQRAAELAKARDKYQYDWNTKNAPGVPLLKDLPVSEYFSARYIFETGTALLKIKANEALPPFHRDSDRAEGIDDYKKLFVILPEPDVAKKSLWATDESFGEQRLSGANPMSIRRATDRASIAELLPEELGQALGTSTVETELEAGRLFYVDHRPVLKPITEGGQVTLNGKVFPKHLAKTAGLFWWNRHTERLMPISVLVEGTEQGLFLAHGDTDAWLRAKIAFQACDGVVHEMSTHLGHTHLVMEGIGIAVRRNLAEAHPMLRLLIPHLRFMMSINQLAEEELIKPGGEVDVAFGGPIAQVVGVAAQAYKDWNFTERAFPNDIASRGVGAGDNLPIYAYRDDAALYWSAISEYVEAYVGIYYSNDHAVEADGELAAWSKEVGAPAPNGAAIQGFPALKTVSELVFALTQIIFTCSVQHSAVNYPQNDYLIFAPNSPFATWAEIDTPNLMDLLPPIGPVEGQISLLSQLTAINYDELGDYAGKYTKDERANQVIREFSQGMVEIDAAITSHQQQRWQSYEYLRPKNVTNSISI